MLQGVKLGNFGAFFRRADRENDYLWGRLHAADRLIDLVYDARPAGISFEAANPRHAHEWAVFMEHPLPDDKVIYPGVIDSTTNFIEHPLLVAERICRFADIVGRERVIAGTDCGFATFAGFGAVDADVVYAKLGALVEGAGIASARLWT